MIVNFELETCVQMDSSTFLILFITYQCTIATMTLDQCHQALPRRRSHRCRLRALSIYIVLLTLLWSSKGVLAFLGYLVGNVL
jgi:hypothetical protein